MSQPIKTQGRPSWFSDRLEIHKRCRERLVLASSEANSVR